MTPTLKMNTQPLGDRTPGDKNYFDLEDEETPRATGSGHNPNAAAWDPEKMVNWLPSLEEKRALTARPVERLTLTR